MDSSEKLVEYFLKGFYAESVRLGVALEKEGVSGNELVDALAMASCIFFMGVLSSVGIDFEKMYPSLLKVWKKVNADHASYTEARAWYEAVMRGARESE